MAHYVVLSVASETEAQVVAQSIREKVRELDPRVFTLIQLADACARASGAYSYPPPPNSEPTEAQTRPTSRPPSFSRKP